MTTATHNRRGWVKAAAGVYTRDGWTATRQDPSRTYRHRTGNHVWVRWWRLTHPDQPHAYYEADLASCAWRIQHLAGCP